MPMKKDAIVATTLHPTNTLILITFIAHSPGPAIQMIVVEGKVVTSVSITTPRNILQAAGRPIRQEVLPR